MCGRSAVRNRRLDLRRPPSTRRCSTFHLRHGFGGQVGGHIGGHRIGFHPGGMAATLASGLRFATHRGLRRAQLFLVIAGLVAELRAVATAADTVIEPKEVISLFNGKDPPHFTRGCLLSAAPIPIASSPSSTRSTVRRPSERSTGSFVTKANYATIKLVVEFRWGSVTWKPRETRPRLWICSTARVRTATTRRISVPVDALARYQIIDGGTGDLLLLNGYDRGSDQILAPD